VAHYVQLAARRLAEFHIRFSGLGTAGDQFLLQSGEVVRAFKHVGALDQAAIRIELISEVAVKTSEIEGENLNRDSVQSSLRHQLGLGPEAANIPAAERGIAKMMVGAARLAASARS